MTQKLHFNVPITFAINHYCISVFIKKKVRPKHLNIPPDQNPHQTVARYGLIIQGFCAPNLIEFTWWRTVVLKVHFVGKDYYSVRKIAYFLVLQHRIDKLSALHDWFVSLRSGVTWILYSIIYRSFLRIRCIGLLEIANCSERRIDLHGPTCTTFSHGGDVF